MGLDRHRADVAHEEQWAGVETGVAAVTTGMLARLCAARREALLAVVRLIWKPLMWRCMAAASREWPTTIRGNAALDVLRLLVKDVLIGPERINIRHRIPIRTTTSEQHDSADTEGRVTSVRIAQCVGDVIAEPCGVPRSHCCKVPSGSCDGASSHRRTYSTTHGRSVCASTALTVRSHETLSKNF